MVLPCGLLLLSSAASRCGSGAHQALLGKQTWAAINTYKRFQSSRTKERGAQQAPSSSSEPSPPLDLESHLPVVYVHEYGRLIDTALVRATAKPKSATQEKEHIPELEKDTRTTGFEASMAAKKVDVLLKSLKETKTYETLVDAVRLHPHPRTTSSSSLFDPPVSTGGVTPAEAAGMTTTAKRSEAELMEGVPAATLTETLRAQEEKRKRSVEMQMDESADLLKWNSTKLDPRLLPKYYLMLSKSRLTLLVCLTAGAGYGMAPCAFDPATFALVSIGTGLISASANSINQFLEVPFDSQMNRTKNRVLVRGCLSSAHAMGFAAATAVTGTMILGFGVNGVTASLGLANLFLYTSVYTPMKRVSIANTWVGSVVGAIPPLMGYTAATGTLDYGALILAGILYAWQFPHFNSLSWNLRPDYSKAGYRMMSVTNPDLCRRVALRYSLGLIGICSVAAPYLGVTSTTFALDSLPFNAYLVYLAWNFHQKADSESSRRLFRFTLIHLPLIMILMFISKESAEKANVNNAAAQVTTAVAAS